MQRTAEMDYQGTREAFQECGVSIASEGQYNRSCKWFRDITNLSISDINHTFYLENSKFKFVGKTTDENGEPFILNSLVKVFWYKFNIK